MKILDSDHCVAVLRGRLRLPDEELAITTINVAELVHGAFRSARLADNLASVDILLSALTILPFDEASARIFGELKALLERSGYPLDDLDLQIASIALANDAILVTHNQRHFVRVPGIVLEDWMQS